MLTTTETTLNIGSGVSDYGSYDSFSSDYFTSATTGYDYASGYDTVDLSSANGTYDIFLNRFLVASEVSEASIRTSPSGRRAPRLGQSAA
jgi:hypothetical protein